MKKTIVSIVASFLLVSMLLSSCGGDTPSSSEAASNNSGASSAEAASDDISSDEAGSGDTSQAESAAGISSNSTTNTSSKAPANNTSSKTTANNTSSKTETPVTPAAVEAYARFKLTGGDPSIERIILKDMDGKGFIGSCPQSYLNTQTNETIKNAEWKSDSKFRNYFHGLHSATKIIFDCTEDVEKPEEKSAALTAELPYTIAAWIKPDGTYKPEGNPDFRVIAAYGTNNGTREHWDFKLNSDNTLSYYNADIPSDARTGLDSSYKVPNDTWTHVAVQVSTTGITYFANGQKVDSVTFKSPMTRDTCKTGRRTFAIGSLTEGAYSLRGGIAEFGIYKGLVDPKDTTSVAF